MGARLHLSASQSFSHKSKAVNVLPHVIEKAELLRFSTEILERAGVARGHAEEWAEVLVWANLRGVDSHGVLRLPQYLRGIKAGTINPRPNMQIERSAGATALIEADLAPGPIAMRMAADHALQLSEKYHVGWCVVRNITHAGAIGYYAREIARNGHIGVIMTASFPMMAYEGARVAGVSTNPLAIAVPGATHPPLVLDMSSAKAAWGKVLDARDAGLSLPEGSGLDAQGVPTGDPGAITTLLPVGGAKGAGLSLMIEALTSVLANNPLIEPALTASQPRSGRPNNGLAVAVDIAAFCPLEIFQENIDALARTIVALPRAEGTDTIFAPGERGDAILRKREVTGIPLPQGTWERLTEIADNLGVAMPGTLEE